MQTISWILGLSVHAQTGHAAETEQIPADAPPTQAVLQVLIFSL